MFIIVYNHRVLINSILLCTHLVHLRQLQSITLSINLLFTYSRSIISTTQELIYLLRCVIVTQAVENRFRKFYAGLQALPVAWLFAVCVERSHKKS